MMKSVSSIPVEYLVEVTYAGYFLKSPELLELCCSVLNRDSYKEVNAFTVIHKMRLYDELSQISESLTNRISSCALIVINSTQFLELTDVQICVLLKSSRLAVNSETEVILNIFQRSVKDL